MLVGRMQKEHIPHAQRLYFAVQFVADRTVKQIENLKKSVIVQNVVVPFGNFRKEGKILGCEPVVKVIKSVFHIVIILYYERKVNGIEKPKYQYRVCF